MIPRLDSARLMINLGFPLTTELPSIPYGQFSPLFINAHSRGADFKTSTSLPVQNYEFIMPNLLMLSFICQCHWAWPCTRLCQAAAFEDSCHSPFWTDTLAVSIPTAFNLLLFLVFLAWCYFSSFLCHLWFFAGLVLMARLFPFRSPVWGVGFCWFSPFFLCICQRSTVFRYSVVNFILWYS